MRKTIQNNLKIYTKTGDKGETSLFGGKRVPKYHLRVEAYGTVDELNSAIGVVIAGINSSQLTVKNVKKELEKIQNDLLDIGSTLASPSSKFKVQSSKFLEKRVKEMEAFIDEMTEQISPLSQFILPGGGKAGSQLHFVRTVCRRAERRIVELSQKEQISKDIIIYVNRLSDLLFTMARFINHKEKQKETIWKKNM